MSLTRRFLLAPSLSRLIEKERGGLRITEGYFPDQSDQNIYVRIEEGMGTLVLMASGAGEAVEEPAELPRAHAEALLAFAAGGIDYRRIDLRIGTHSAHISRFFTPERLDLIAVESGQEEQARKFQPPPWFGPEVTAEPTYRNRSVALAGRPAAPEVELTNAALDSLLDVLENRSESSQLPIVAPVPAPPPTTDAEEDADDLGSEDRVIRELARSLRPKHC
jgi:CYTH domain-containing protein